MTAGRLKATNLAATTNTVVYTADIEHTASVLVTAANRTAGVLDYRLALRDYDQILQVSGPQENSNGGVASIHEFQKGNPISGYRLKLSPGFTYQEAIPGAQITSNNGAQAKILDVFKPTDTITYYTKFVDLSDLILDSVVGIPVGGETITGGTSGLTATNRGYLAATETAHVEIADVASGSTSIKVSRNTGLADAMKLTVGLKTAADTEIITIDGSGINTTTNTLTVTRGAHATTARAIKEGEFVKAYSVSATASTINEGATYSAGDVTLTITDATGFLTGAFIICENEILEVTDVNGNDLTVTRGMYGTADVDHNNTTAVTVLTDGGDYLVNYFTEGENLTFGTSNATATCNFTVAAQSIEVTPSYVISTTSVGATDHEIVEPIILNNERVYKFDQVDASNAGHPLKFSSDNEEGANSPTGTEFTTGVQKVGTAGQAGAYSQITIDDNIPTTLYTYSDAGTAGGPAADEGAGFEFSTILAPAYEEIFIYDLQGEPFAVADTFTIGGSTQTVQSGGITAGPYGYVHAYDASTALLKVSLQHGSQAFANGDLLYDTPTKIAANRVLTEVVDGKILTIASQSGADGSRTAGTYTSVAYSAQNSGSGATFNVVVDGSGAATVTIVDGGKGFVNSETITIADSVLGAGGAANLTFDVNTVTTGITVAATAIEDQDYLHYDLDVAANTQQRDAAIVVGPGQNLIARASGTGVSVVVQGFETASSDYPIIHLPKE